jgi:tetratricopeptide (TPR) repeat protein
VLSSQNEKLEWAIITKNAGNELYAEEKFAEALEKYVECLTAANFTGEESVKRFKRRHPTGTKANTLANARTSAELSPLRTHNCKNSKVAFRDDPAPTFQKAEASQTEAVPENSANDAGGEGVACAPSGPIVDIGNGTVEPGMGTCNESGNPAGDTVCDVAHEGEPNASNGELVDLQDIQLKNNELGEDVVQSEYEALRLISDAVDTAVPGVVSPKDDFSGGLVATNTNVNETDGQNAGTIQEQKEYVESMFVVCPDQPSESSVPADVLCGQNVGHDQELKEADETIEANEADGEVLLDDNNVDTLVVPVLCNMAACCMQLKYFAKAAMFCDQALALRPLCAKALMRKGINNLVLARQEIVK